MECKTTALAMALVAALGMSGGARANTTYQLADLLLDSNTGQPRQVQVGDKLFGGWDFQIVDAPTTAEFSIDQSKILVEPMDDQPLALGLRFSANGGITYKNTSAERDDLTLRLSYTAQATGGQLIKGTSITLVSSQFNEGSIESSEMGFIALESVYKSGNSLGPPVFVTDQRLMTQTGEIVSSLTFMSGEFSAPAPSVEVVTLFSLYGILNLGSDSPGFIDAVIEQRFSQTVVPLPAAAWLLGAGFLGYFGVGYSRRNDTA